MEGALVFLHGSVQVLGLFIELPQGRAGLQCGVLLLVVNVERLCLGYLDLIAVSKDGKEKPTTTPFSGCPDSVFLR